MVFTVKQYLAKTLVNVFRNLQFTIGSYQKGKKVKKGVVNIAISSYHKVLKAFVNVSSETELLIRKNS